MRHPVLGATLALTTVLVLLAALPTSVWACPSCQAALAASDGSQGDLVSGIFWSILFMMSMPFMILGAFSGSMYLAVRRARATAPVPEDGRSQQQDRELVEV